jgi:hypothetical protein
VCLGFSDEYGSWKTIWMFRCNSAMLVVESFEKSLSSRVICPEVGVRWRARRRPVVDFPHPVSPTRPRVSFGAHAEADVVNRLHVAPARAGRRCRL